MDVAIRIASEVSQGRRRVFWNDELSHHLPEPELQEVLKEARSNVWKSSASGGGAFSPDLRLAGVEGVIEDVGNRHSQVISGEETATGVEQIPVGGMRGIKLHALETGVGPQAIET
jgi:hypothetical protein